jgi:hypothetical protein
MTPDIPLDDACRLGRQSRRRQALGRLADPDVGPPLTAERLARHVAAAESRQPPAAVPRDACERVHLELRHCHLPRLAAAGVVDYCVDTDRLVGWVDDPTAILPRVAATRLARCVSANGEEALDVSYDLLSHRDRRTLLWVLSRCELPATLETLAAHLLLADTTRPAADRVESLQSAEERSEWDRLNVQLTHQHVPKLAAWGVIAVDDDTTVLRTCVDASVDWRDCSPSASNGELGEERTDRDES